MNAGSASKVGRVRRWMTCEDLGVADFETNQLWYDDGGAAFRIAFLEETKPYQGVDGKPPRRLPT